MKKSNFLFMGLVSVLLCGTSCGNDTDLGDFAQTAVQENDQQELHLCTTDLVNADLLGESDTVSQKAVLNRLQRWKTGTTIRIKFLNGDSFLQNKVKQYACEWVKYANLHFEFVESKDSAEIRVAFDWNGDLNSWCHLGTACTRDRTQYKPTMNLGGLTRNASENYFKYTILHQFGHALSMVDEHRHPENTIQWNKGFVYNYFADKRGWTPEYVDKNYLNKNSKYDAPRTTYDVKSIMHEPISACFTLNGQGVDMNTELAPKDIELIRQQYPGK